MSKPKKFTLVFDEIELYHILTAVCDERDRGDYWGRRDQYIKRVDRIIAKIEKAMNQ